MPSSADSLLDFPIVRRQDRICQEPSIGKTSVDLSSWSGETTFSFRSVNAPEKAADYVTRGAEFIPSDPHPLLRAGSPTMIEDTTQRLLKKSELSTTGDSSSYESTTYTSSEGSSGSYGSSSSDTSDSSANSSSSWTTGSSGSSSCTSGTSCSRSTAPSNASIRNKFSQKFFIGVCSPKEAEDTVILPTHFCTYIPPEQEDDLPVFCYLSERSLYHHFPVRSTRLFRANQQEHKLYFIFSDMYFDSVVNLATFYAQEIEAARNRGIDAFTLFLPKFDRIEKRRLKNITK